MFAYDDLTYLAMELPEDVKFYRYQGDFDGEIACIDRILTKDTIPAVLRKRLETERNTAILMRQDYSLSAGDLLLILQKQYPALTEKDIVAMTESGHADYILRNGKPYYQDDAPSNLLCQCGAYMRHVQNPAEAVNPVCIDTWRADMDRIMREKGRMARHFRCRLSVKPDDNNEELMAAVDGKDITVHLPIPAECETQSDIRILATSHEAVVSDAKQRTVCFRTKYEKGMDFWVEYEYTNTAVWHELNPDAVEKEQPTFDTEEQYPHIRFTPYMKALAAEIAGEETNPLLLARRVYDYIAKNIRYSYMRTYAAIDMIPEFAVLNGRGDCGVQALVFITLCRILKIPAAWESGHGMGDTSMGPHDWARFYIAPFGWLPCDPCYGSGAYQNGDFGKWNHYFGNLDPYRDVTCTAFQEEFVPAKRFIRSDPYDSQSGEIEFPDRGLRSWEMCGSKTVLSCEECR